MLHIECDDGASWSAIAASGIVEATVRIEFPEYPERAPEVRYVVGIERDGVTVCEADEYGSPLARNVTSLIPWDEILKVVVL